ncbi:MAG: hypothetical protein ABID61_02105 [Candidatus Micrarchaeota archaeon]
MKDYCTKCRVHYIFGKLSEELIVEEQMKKNGIDGDTSDIIKNKKELFRKLTNSWVTDQRKKGYILAGCMYDGTCKKCKTKLIEKKG